MRTITAILVRTFNTKGAVTLGGQFIMEIVREGRTRSYHQPGEHTRARLARVLHREVLHQPEWKCTPWLTEYSTGFMLSKRRDDGHSD